MNFFDTFKAVFWSFFGVRKSRDHSADMQKLKPVHVIVAGLVAAASFVLILILIVRFVVSQGN